jgi:hypothetical protein
MISFPLMLKHMGVFILIVIYFLLFMHRPSSHVINDFFNPLMLISYYEQHMFITL